MEEMRMEEMQMHGSQMEEPKMLEPKMSIGKKIGYFFLSWTPLLAYLAIMFAVTFVAEFIIGMMVGIQAGISGADISNVEELTTLLLEAVMEYTMTIGLIYGILGLICMALWYYFGCKRKQLRPAKGVVHPTNFVLIAVLAFCMQYVVSYLMVVVGMLLPKAMENYEQMTELAGVGEVTIMGILYVGIIGPITEEFTFRGVTMYFAQKFTKSFWLANTLQAIGFGILHLNLIQGLYAFVLGLLIGWLYNRFRSLYVVCWFHMVFNLLSFGVMESIDGLLPENTVFQIFWAVLMFVGAVFCVWMLQRRGKSLAEGAVA